MTDEKRDAREDGSGKQLIMVLDPAGETYRLCRRILHEQYRVAGSRLADGPAGAGCEKPDLILLDVNGRPEQAVELCRELSRSQEYRDIPVIVLHSQDQAASMERACAQGAADRMSKPIIPALLSKRIQTVLERYSSGKMVRCSECYRPMRNDWLFCPFDGTRIARTPETRSP